MSIMEDMALERLMHHELGIIQGKRIREEEILELLDEEFKGYTHVRISVRDLKALIKGEGQ